MNILLCKLLRHLSKDIISQFNCLVLVFILSYALCAVQNIEELWIQGLGRHPCRFAKMGTSQLLETIKLSFESAFISIGQLLEDVKEVLSYRHTFKR